ncbi:hypothetical protein TRSC58_07567 [Trypanosoma rangeli SC58]|uniref:Transmembrane protein n=1 Tax=Trypanosoma rangeli SC58 TaxID=429131 RepID=A0A061IV00_TRYRA|nr:hypothetical protein TRSC58_07567 [Trypanosoma rangeli SC58]
MKATPHTPVSLPSFARSPLSLPFETASLASVFPPVLFLLCVFVCDFLLATSHFPVSSFPRCRLTTFFCHFFVSSL